MIQIFSIPKHVVFLANEVPLFYGHQKYPDFNQSDRNFGKILECVDWSLKFQIEEITVSLFSYIAFKFPSDEVTKTMSAFRTTLVKWIDSEVIVSKGIRLKVHDTLAELPSDISYLVRILQDVTKNNRKMILNLLIGHPGEIHLRNLEIKFQSSECKFEQDMFAKCIFSFENEPQLIISNCTYKRLTDYLMWKTSSRRILHFHKSWNALKFYDFLRCLIYFQFHETSRSKL